MGAKLHIFFKTIVTFYKKNGSSANLLRWKRNATRETACCYERNNETLAEKRRFSARDNISVRTIYK